MTRRPLTLALWLATSTVALMAAPALAKPRSGTPNQEKAELIGPRSIRVSWFDTNRHEGGPKVIFEVEAQSPFDVSSGCLQLASYDPGQRNHWDAVDLHPHGRSNMCYRIWSRDPDDDLRSELPSAWACAVVPLELRAAGGTMVSDLGMPMPVDTTVWIAQQHDRLTPETDGFVMSIVTGRDCPHGWHAVLHQNGGFPGYGEARDRTARDPDGCAGPIG